MKRKTPGQATRTGSTTSGRSLTQFLQKFIGRRPSIFCCVAVAANTCFGAGLRHSHIFLSSPQNKGRVFRPGQNSPTLPSLVKTLFSIGRFSSSARERQVGRRRFWQKRIEAAALLRLHALNTAPLPWRKTSKPAARGH